MEFKPIPIGAGDPYKAERASLEAEALNAFAVPKDMIGDDNRNSSAQEALEQINYGMTIISNELAKTFRAFNLAVQKMVSVMAREFIDKLPKADWEYYLKKKKNGHPYKMRVIKKWINRARRERKEHVL